MLGRRISILLLQHCAASQQQLQQCCWTAAACLSTTAANCTAAAAASAQHIKGQEGAAAAATSKGSSHPSRWPGVKQQQFLDFSFDQLHKQVQQQFALQSPQKQGPGGADGVYAAMGYDSEGMLLLLISKASDAAQVQSAVQAVHTNHLKRCRIRQPQMFSTQVLSALLKAGQRAGLGHSFALQLLEQANHLGLQTSRSICEDVVISCLKQKDYPAAAQAWVYSHMYCSSASSSTSKTDTAKQGSETAENSQAEAAWASKSLIRIYLRGMTEWLAAGGVSTRHKQRLLSQLSSLASELEGRGASVPTDVHKVLADAGNSQKHDPVEAAAEGEKPLNEQTANA